MKPSHYYALSLMAITCIVSYMMLRTKQPSATPTAGTDMQQRLDRAFTVGRELGYRDGWIDYSIDQYAVNDYRSTVDNMIAKNLLPGTNRANLLSNIWADCQRRALSSFDQWNNLSITSKLSQKFIPKWRVNSLP